jgi:protein-disulfide isomerase
MRPRRPHGRDPRSKQLSSKTATPGPQSRRERRAAERARETPIGRGPAATSRRGSPVLWITALVGVVALVLVGALVLLQGGPSAKVDAAGLHAPTTPTSAASADGRSLGKADAPVTLEVWSDFQCPACGQYAEVVEPLLVRDYVTPGTLRIVHHDAAFQGAKSKATYDESVEAGAGARCAADQGRYWPFHDWLFANQSGENKGAFADARLRAIAISAGLDVPKWDACRATGEQQTAARSETAQGAAKGVNATPTLYLNGEAIVGLKSATELGQKIMAAAGK